MDGLTQQDADRLMRMEKVPTKDGQHYFPPAGERLSFGLSSHDKKETFSLTLYCSRIGLVRVTFQNLARKTIVLGRVDIGGSPHVNPDGEKIQCPHIHLYREGFGDKWASPLPSEHFSDHTDPLKTLYDFMKYCNVVNPPHFNKTLL